MDWDCSNNNGSIGSSWKHSYYLTNWPDSRLTPCWTLDPLETKVIQPKASQVMTEK